MLSKNAKQKCQVKMSSKEWQSKECQERLPRK